MKNCILLTSHKKENDTHYFTLNLAKIKKEEFYLQMNSKLEGVSYTPRKIVLNYVETF